MKKNFTKGTALALGLVLAGAGLTASAALGTGSPWAQNLTDAQKATVQQAQELRSTGKVDEAKTLLESNGLGGIRAGRGMGNMQSMTDEERTAFEAAREVQKTSKEAMRTAVEDNDYNAFLTAQTAMKVAIEAARPGDGSIANRLERPEVTAEVFAKMVEAHTLRASGDVDGAREIMKELGFPMRGGFGGGNGQGRGDGGMGRLEVSPATSATE